MDKALEKKLLISKAKRVTVINAPSDLFRFEGTKEGSVDVLLVFVRDKKDVSMSVDQAISSLGSEGVLWFAYPKKSSGIKTDINRDSGWSPLAKNKFVPVTSNTKIDSQNPKWTAAFNA